VRQGCDRASEVTINSGLPNLEQHLNNIRASCGHSASLWTVWKTIPNRPRLIPEANLSGTKTY
jgi:hypothetical protein